MTETTFPATARKPRIALMGEFSAGKSTLTNLLIGEHRIPMRVTATQLPPVWLSWGEDAPYREDLEGNRHPIEGDTLDGVPVGETAFIRLFLKAEVLEVCDIIDTPGISDPNMAPEVWQRAAVEADGVLWLTHATQAWRQSEAAVWEGMPEDLFPRSLLLLTRIDKLLTERDRARVIARVRKETAGQFRAVLPISVTRALAAEGDEAAWDASGGAAFSDALLDLVQDIQRELKRGALSGARRELAPLPARPVAAAPAVRRVQVARPAEPEPAAAPAEDAGPARPERVRLRVVAQSEPPVDGQPAAPAPRRVAREPGAATVRPARPAT